MLYPMPEFGRITKEKQMKPFDLEAAKAGQPIATVGGFPYTFVGISRSGDVVAEDRLGLLCRLAPSCVQMVEERKTYYVNAYRHTQTGTVSVGNAYTTKSPDDISVCFEFIKTIEFEA
jgi:hypothetical protein